MAAAIPSAGRGKSRMGRVTGFTASFVHPRDARVKYATAQLRVAEQALPIRLAQGTPLPRWQVIERQPPDAAAMQRQDMVAHRGEHAPHLVIAAFDEGEMGKPRFHRLEPRGRERR